MSDWHEDEDIDAAHRSLAIAALVLAAIISAALAGLVAIVAPLLT